MAFANPDEFYAALAAHITKELDGVREAVLATILPNVQTTNAQVGADAVKIDEIFRRTADLQKQVDALNAK